MDTRHIGSLAVSVVGLGCNNFGSRLDETQTRRVVHAALDAGINFFDTADIYGGTLSEEYVGRSLGARRKEVVLATKFGMEVDAQRKGARPEYVRQACADSLQRLGTDYIDLYWLHQPDPAVPIADTLGALHELAREGKVRELGCSNFTAAQLREADAETQRLGGPRFVAVQNEYSLYHREPEGAIPEGAAARAGDGPAYPGDGVAKRGVLEQCAQLGLGFVPYFPLSSGLLSGKYRKGQDAPEGTRLAVSPRGAKLLTDVNLDIVEQLIAFAKQRGHTLLELAISWLLSRTQVASVIAGATLPDQARANAAAGAWRMSADELAEIDRLTAVWQH